MVLLGNDLYTSQPSTPDNDCERYAFVDSCNGLFGDIGQLEVFESDADQQDGVISDKLTAPTQHKDYVPTLQNEMNNSKSTFSHAITQNNDCFRTNLTDWRWPAKQGCWIPELCSWNSEIGKMNGHMQQSDEYRAQTLCRQPRAAKAASIASERFLHGIEEVNPFKRKLNLIEANALSHGRRLNDETLALGTPLLRAMATRGWGHFAARRYWNAGYRAEPVLRLFDEMPPPLRAAIAGALDAAQLCADCAAHAGASDAGPQSPSPAQQCTQWEAWKEDAVHGTIERLFDPATQVRSSHLIIEIV